MTEKRTWYYPKIKRTAFPILIHFTNIRKDMSLELGKGLRAIDPNLIVYAETLEAF